MLIVRKLKSRRSLVACRCPAGTVPIVLKTHMAANCDDRAQLLATIPYLPPCTLATPWRVCNYNKSPNHRNHRICLTCEAASIRQVTDPPDEPPGFGIWFNNHWSRNLPATPDPGFGLGLFPQPAVSPPQNPWPFFPVVGGGRVIIGNPLQPAGIHTVNDPPWPGFLTRTCLDCEDLIQREIHYRTPQVTPAGVHAPPVWPHDPNLDRPRVEWQHYPVISCTCKFRLGLIPNSGRTLCSQHRNTVKAEMIAEMKINEKWLRNVEMPMTSRPNGFYLPSRKLRQTSIAWKRQRVLNGDWRACRVSTFYP